MLATLMLLAATAGPPLPADVRRFLSDRELCEHFESEEPYDKARAAFLAKQVARYCPRIDDRLKRLKARHAGERQLLKVLPEPLGD